MKAHVLYDGDCAFCRKSISILAKLDWLGKLDYISVRDPAQPILQEPRVAQAPLLDQLHVMSPDGKTFEGGFRAFRWMAWRLPLTWLIAPFLYLPGVPWLGQKAYMWVARNRFKLVPCNNGECQLPQARR